MSTSNTTRFSALTQQRRHEANAVAQFLLDKCELDTMGRRPEGVELFGSLARGNVNESSDIDLIVLVEGFTAARWMKEFQDRMGKHAAYEGGNSKQVRRELALEYLDYDDLIHDLDFSRTDMFLFPHEWRTRSYEFRYFYPSWKDSFFRNIAHDAIAYIRDEGFPFPSIQQVALARDPSAYPY